MKRTPLRKVNPERLARLRAKQFGGPYRDLIISLPCCACGAPPPSEPSHVRTRGAGGEASDQTPLCRFCHSWFEEHPKERKERFAPVAAVLWAMWQSLGGDNGEA